MTIPSTTRKAGPYFGTGAQTVWPFTFKVFAAEDVAVTTTTAQGLNTLRVLNTDYSVTLNANQDTSPGGVVTYPLAGSPLPPGNRLTIVGDLDYDQPMDLPGGGDFNPVVIENQLDRTVMQIQQLAEAQSRSLQVSVASSTVDTTLPLPVPSHVIGWDQSGTGMQNYSLTDLIVSGVYSDWVTDVFVGTGTQTAFGLQRSPGVLGNCDVSVDGLTALPGIDFFLAANILTFAVAPASGAQILVRYGSAAQQAPTVGAFLKTETQTAGAGQTAFTLTNPYQVGLGALSVFVNGVRMEPVYDYAETNTTTVTFTSGLVAGDRVLFIIGMEVTTGTPGRGITSVNRTSGTGAPGTTDTYTITYSDSTTSTFQVYNGANGTGTGDVVGPASAVNNNFVSFNATTGKLIKDSGSSAASFEPAITAGTTAQYRRGDKTWQDFFTDVRAAVMTGLSTATATAVAATDTLLVAIGKLQAQITGKFDKTGGNITGNVGIGFASPSPQVVLHTLANSAGNPDTTGSGVTGVTARFQNINVNFDFGVYANGTGWIQPRFNGDNSNVFSTYLNPVGGIVLIGPGGLLSNGGAVGYGAGAGGTVTQATSKVTAVTLNKPSGRITTAADALGANAETSFTFYNSFIGVYDTVAVVAGNNSNYTAIVGGLGTGLCNIILKNRSGGSLAEAVVINFSIIKGSDT